MYGYATWLTAQPSAQSGGIMQLGGRRDRDGDADGSGAASASDASSLGAFLKAFAQALESLGQSLDPTVTASGSGTRAAPAATPATVAPTGTAPGTADTAASTSTAATPAPGTASGGAPIDSHEVHRIVRDLRHVLGALFSDIQAENVLAPASAGSSSSSSFGSGLAALISQVQSGSVPANLQNAFGKLLSDLEKIGGFKSANGAPVTPSATPAAATAPAAPPATATPANPPASTAPSAVAPGTSATASPQSTSTTQATAGGVSNQGLLLQFLTNLQSDLGLGYGASSSAPAKGATSGLMVNTLA